MQVDPAAVLALIAEQQARIMHLSKENQELRQRVEDHQRTNGGEPS